MTTTTLASPTVAGRFIEIEGVGKRYVSRHGEGIDAIQDVSLEIHAGEFVSLVGPSGCGKSTLLKMLGQLLQPTQGAIRYFGLQAGQTKPKIGMVFQEAVLLPWRTVLENVCLPIQVMKLDRLAGKKRALELIELVGLKGFEDKYPSELSGGMQQRASISRALVSRPDLLLMDEPFGALDALTREQMANELQRIWMESGTTVIFVTHSISEAVFLSDRVAVMSGRPSRLQESLNIDIPRPRRTAVMTGPTFNDYVAKIRWLLDHSTEF